MYLYINIMIAIINNNHDKLKSIVPKIITTVLILVTITRKNNNGKNRTVGINNCNNNNIFLCIQNLQNHKNKNFGQK